MSSSDFVNAVQERVHGRLSLLGPGPAAFFLDACRLAADPNRHATTSHLIGHLLREVEGNLLDVLYQQLVAPLPAVTAEPSANLVPPKVVPPDGSKGPDNADSDASPAAAEGIGDDDGGEQKRGHRIKVRAILGALGLPLDGAEARQWIAMAGGKKGLHRVAHRNKLNPPRSVTPTFLAEFDAIVQLFDSVLERFETRYSNVYARLDALLARTEPGADGVALLSKSIPNTPRTLGYFFERLSHGGWLVPLRAAGFFQSPPPPEIDEVRGTIGFPHWSAVDYLERVAATKPADVAEILEQAAPFTENVRVQAQMIGVMLRLRPEDRARLVPAVREWVPRLSQYHWDSQAVELATKLTLDGSIELALELTASLLDLPDPDPKTRKRSVRLAEYRGHAREKSWHLREAAATLVPTLLGADGLRTLTLLADALDYHVGRRPEDTDANPSLPEGLTDFSTLWADDLGRREGVDADDLRVYLAHVTLRSAYELGMQSPERLAEIVGALRQHGARVLRRIELSTLAMVIGASGAILPAGALSLAVERLTDGALTEEDDVAAEWAALLAVVFPRIGMEDRSRILTALKPPDFTWLKDLDYAARRAAAWRRDRLALIAEHLDKDARAELEALVQSLGPAASLEHRGPRIATFSGPSSPLNGAVLRDMSVDALVSFLQAWEPRPGFAEPSPEGFGRQLASMIVEQPAKYASWAARFIGLAPTYVRSFLDGYATVLRGDRDGQSDRSFSWPELLTLAEWIAEQPVPTSDMERESFDADTDWRGARRTLADLLGLGLDQTKAAKFPYAVRQRVWRLIELLASDVNPSPEYEERYGGTNMDPTSLAINTTRPEAIDAAIRYAFWVAENIASNDEGIRDVLATAPEVATLLEYHLDPTSDPSLAVRAAIGQWLGSLTRTDERWVRDHLKALLPDGPEGRARRDALWDAYVRWTQPHPDALLVLEPYYREAATASHESGETVTKFAGEKPGERLAEHLMTLYWWGALDLHEADGLIPHFFRSARAELRRHAIEFVGYSLYHSEKPIPTEPLERLSRLWEWRSADLFATAQDRSVDGRTAAEIAKAELAVFGWWFASGAFDDEWALEQLRSVLSVTGRVELEHAAAERLAELSSQHALEAIRCLAVIDLTGGKEPWSVRSWIEHAETAIVNALKIGGESERAEALAVTNRLIAAGYIDFRRLLDGS